DGKHATVHGQGVLLGTILGLNFNGDVVAIVLDRGGLVPGQKLNAKLLVLLSNLLGDVLVLIWKNAIHELNDGDVHAIVRKNISKLHTDGSCADDNHGIWLFLVKDLLFVRYDVAANLYTWQRTNNRAGSNDGVIKGNGLTLVVALGNLEGLSVLKRAESVNFGNLVLLQQGPDTPDDARRNLTGTLVGDTEVEAHVTGNTKGLSLMVEGIRYFSILKQCLGWDTSIVH